MFAFRRIFLAAAAFLAFVVPAAAQQRAPTGVAVSASALLTPEQLHSDTPLGMSGSLLFGVSPTLTLDASLASYGQTPFGSETYKVLAPTVGVRANLAGGDTDLAGYVGVGALHYSVMGVTVDQDRTRTVPLLGVGLNFRSRIAGPAYLGIAVTDWLSAVPADALTRSPGSRKFAQIPEIKISLSFLFQHKDPQVADLRDLPLSYRSDFRPVDASTVRYQPNRATQGRDHVHVDDIGARELVVTPTPPVVPDPAAANPEADMGATVEMGTVIPLIREDTLNAVFFEDNSLDIAPGYDAMLADLGKRLVENPQMKLRLVGFASQSGTAQYNMTISEKRATAVKARLVSEFGIAHNRIDAVGNGIDEDANRAAPARRVEIVLLVPQEGAP